MELEDMTNDELADLIEEAQRTLARRQSIAALDQQIGVLLRDAREGGVVDPAPEGAAWAAPSGAHDAYLKGDVVIHDGKRWSSLMDYNVWAPGASGWREVPGDDEDGNAAVPEYVQPTGTHDAYQTGDRVTFDGAVWESVIDNNTWSPVDYPQGWREVS